MGCWTGRPGAELTTTSEAWHLRLQKALILQKRKFNT
jgi:hypothetical protein